MTGLASDNGLRLYLYCLAGSAWDWARESERVAAFDMLTREGLRGVDERHPIQMLHAEGIVAVAHKLLGKRLVSASARVYNETGSVSVDWRVGHRVPSFPKVAPAPKAQETQRRVAAGSAPSAC